MDPRLWWGAIGLWWFTMLLTVMSFYGHVVYWRHLRCRKCLILAVANICIFVFLVAVAAGGFGRKL